MMSLPNSANSRLLPERNPSPTPTSNSNDPTPQAIPNMVRKERNLWAQRLRKICAKMSTTTCIIGHSIRSSTAIGRRARLRVAVPRGCPIRLSDSLQSHRIRHGCRPPFISFRARERLRMKIQDYMPDRRSICHPKAANKVLGANGDRAAASTRMELTETVSAAPQYSDPASEQTPCSGTRAGLQQSPSSNVRGGVTSKPERRCRGNVQLNSFDLFAGHLSFAITRSNLGPSVPSFKAATDFTG